MFEPFVVNLSLQDLPPQKLMRRTATTTMRRKMRPELQERAGGIWTEFSFGQNPEISQTFSNQGRGHASGAGGVAKPQVCDGGAECSC